MKYMFKGFIHVSSYTLLTSFFRPQYFLLVRSRTHPDSAAHWTQQQFTVTLPPGLAEWINNTQSLLTALCLFCIYDSALSYLLMLHFYPQKKAENGILILRSIRAVWLSTFTCTVKLLHSWILILKNSFHVSVHMLQRKLIIDLLSFVHLHYCRWWYFAFWTPFLVTLQRS